MDAEIYQKFTDLERDHWWFQGRRKVYMGILSAHLNQKEGEKVLDLGCGLGGFMNELENLGYEVYGADIDHDSLVHCKTRGYNLCTLIGNGPLPFADNSFNLITMFDAIEHIEDDHSVMAEIQRVLKPGGSIIISVPAYQFLFSNNDVVAQHYRRYNRDSVRQLFEQSGLTVTRNTHTNVLLFPAILTVVLASKLLSRTLLKNKKSRRNNLDWRLPRPINNLLYKLFACELAVSRKFDIPTGHSIVAIARTKR